MGDIRPLDLKQLLALLYVHDYGGYTEAGKMLCVSQSAISWRVKMLSEKLGRELVVVYGGNKFTFTEEGLRVVAIARDIFSLMNRLQSGDPLTAKASEVQKAFAEAQAANARLFSLVQL